MAESLRIVAYNFLLGGSRKRAGHWARLLERFSPDLVLAQECRPPQVAPGEPRFLAEADAPLWSPAGSARWGSALYARSARVAPLEVPGFSGRVMGGAVEIPGWSNGRPLRVFSIHTPSGARGYVRTMHEILDRLAGFREGADLVLGGDFNVVVGVRKPDEEIRASKRESELLRRLLDEFDLISCWQAMHPDRPLAQTLRWSANRSAPYHCDGIFVPSSWRAHLRSCEVFAGPEWERLSDHNPVVAVFEKAGSGGRVQRAPGLAASNTRTHPRPASPDASGPDLPYDGGDG